MRGGSCESSFRSSCIGRAVRIWDGYASIIRLELLFRRLKNALRSISEPPLTTTTCSVVGWRRRASSSVGAKSRVTSTPLTSAVKDNCPKYAGSTPRKTMAARGNSR